MPPFPNPMGLTRRMSSRFIIGETLLHKFSARSSDKTKSLSRGKNISGGGRRKLQTYRWSDMLDQSLWWGQWSLVSHSLQWERMIPQERWSCEWESIWHWQTQQCLLAHSLLILVHRHWRKGKGISGWSWGLLGRWWAFPSPPHVWSLFPPSLLVFLALEKRVLPSWDFSAKRLSTEDKSYFSLISVWLINFVCPQIEQGKLPFPLESNSTKERKWGSAALCVKSRRDVAAQNGGSGWGRCWYECPL